MARSISTILMQNLKLTGIEILALHDRDLIFDKSQERKRNSKKLALIKDYNENGAYFKGTFGRNQYYYRKLTELELSERGDIECVHESIVGFLDSDTKIERRTDTYCRFESIGSENLERITKEEYNKLSDHLDNIFSSFWGLIDQSKF